jgi:hypothetical protein
MYAIWCGYLSGNMFLEVEKFQMISGLIKIIIKDMSIFRRRQEQLASVNVVEAAPLHNMEAETALSSYLETLEGSDSVSNQLKRIQRDLRGLPPLLRNSTTGEKQETDVEDTPMAEPPAAQLTNTGITKEERKRRKKERRKEEKKAKASKKKDSDEDDDDNEDNE